MQQEWKEPGVPSVLSCATAAAAWQLAVVAFASFLSLATLLHSSNSLSAKDRGQGKRGLVRPSPRPQQPSRPSRSLSRPTNTSWGITALD